jgi:hypothetical protein
VFADGEEEPHLGEEPSLVFEGGAAADVDGAGDGVEVADLPYREGGEGDGDVELGGEPAGCLEKSVEALGDVDDKRAQCR